MEYNKKVIVIGEQGVGKTSFVARVTEGRFISEYKATVGVDCAVKIINRSDNTVVRVVLWDLAGQESFRPLMPQYARSSAGIIIMCDVSRQDTVDSIRKWKSEVDKAIMGSPPCILLVNKFDLPKHIHCVTRDQLDRLCEECRLSGYYETSVKENVNLQIALEELTDLMLKYSSSDLIDDTDNPDGFKLEQNQHMKRQYLEKSKCCE